MNGDIIFILIPLIAMDYPRVSAINSLSTVI